MNQIQSKYQIVGALESLQGGRPENQDFMGFADTPLGFAMVLCDGMGGGPGGRTASNVVVDTVISTLSSYKKGDDIKTAMRQAIAVADNKIAEMTAHTPELQGMGTTIVILVINKRSAHVAHVGDSRLYQFRSGKKVFRTNDHSQVGELVRQGALTEEQARVAPNSNVITRAINGRGIAQPDITELPYESGDRFALCTDGIWGALPEKELIEKLTKGKSASGTVMGTTIDVDKIGNTNGGMHDNLSLVVIDMTTDSKLRVKMGRRIKNLLFTIVAILVLSVLANAWTISAWQKAVEDKEIAVEDLKEQNRLLRQDCIALTTRCEEASKVSRQERTATRRNEQDWLKKENELNNRIQNLQDENEKLKKEIESQKKQANSQEKPNNTKDKAQNSKTQAINNAKNTIGKWINDCGKGNLIKDSDIEDLAKSLSDKNIAKSAVSKLRNAKRYYQRRKPDSAEKQKECFKDAKKELDKIK